MAGVDQNVYALQVSLALETAEADAALGDFSQRISNLENEVSEAARNALGSIEGITDALKTNLSDIAGIAKDINLGGSDVEKSFVGASDTLGDMDQLGLDNLDRLKEEIKLLEEKKDIVEDLHEILKDEDILKDDALKGLENINEAIRRKNLGHADELRLLAEEQGLQRAIGDAGERIGDNTRRNEGHFRKLVAAARKLWGIIQKFDEEAEKFKEANYRVYDSMMQLTNRTRYLSARYGVLREDAMAAYKALADVKTPTNEIDKLAKSVGRAQRITGLSAGTLAEYTRGLRAAGSDAERSSKHIGMLIEAQRRFALSTDDMNRMMQSNTETAQEMAFMFGQDAVEQFTLAEAGYRKAGKELGAPAAAIDDIMKKMKLTGIEASVFYGKLRIDPNADPTERYNQMGEGILEIAKSIVPAATQIDRMTTLTAEQQARLNLLSEQILFMDKNALLMMIRRQNEINKGNVEMLGTYDALHDKLAADLNYRKRLNETYTTASAKWNQIKAGMAGAFGVILSVISEGLYPLLVVLEWVVWGIASVITGIHKFTVWLENALGPLGFIIKWMRVLAGMVLGLAMVIIIAAGALTSFALGFAGLPGLISGVANIISTFLGLIVDFAVAVGEVIYQVMRGIARGIRAVGSAAAANALGLLALGAALMMAGAGAYFFAQGMKILVDIPFHTILIGVLLLVAATYILVTAVGALAPVAGPVVGILWAIGGALALIGAAAWLMGAGLKMAAEAFMMIVEAIGPHSPPLWVKLPMVAAGMMILAYAALISAPGLIVLATTMSMLAISAWLLGPPLGMLATALEKLSGDMIKDFATALWESAGKITGAVLILIPVMLLMPLIAVALIYAGVTLLVAGSLFAVAAILIGFGAKLLGTGMSALAESAKEFKGVDFIGMAFQLMVGGTMIWAAGVPFAIGATFVGIGALLLGFGMQALGKGAKEFQGVNFVWMAGQLAIGGTMLWAAGVPFTIGAALVGIGALLLGGGMLLLGKGAKEFQGVNFVWMAGQLALGGVMLWAAGVPFTIGAALVGIGALLLGGGMLLLGKGAKEFQGVDFVAMAYQLMIGGLLLLAAGLPFVIGANLVGAGALLLGGGLFLLGKGAKTLEDVDFIGMAYKLMVGAVYLMLAGIPFVIGANLVGAGALMLAGGLFMLGKGAKQMEGIKFAEISEDLMKGSGFLIAAAAPLLTGAIFVGAAAFILLPAAFILYIASRWLRYAFDNLQAVASVFEIFAKAIRAISDFIEGFVDSIVDLSKIKSSDLADVSLGIMALGNALMWFGGTALAGGIMERIAGWFSKDPVAKFQKFAALGTKLEAAAKSIRNLGESIKGFGDPADDFIETINKLNEAAKDLDSLDAFESATIDVAKSVEKASTEFSSAIDGFADPADKLIEVLQGLGDAVAGFDNMGAGLEENLQSLTYVLEEYATRLEGVSERIETAINTKALPAIRRAEEAGITEAIRSEAITQVEVMPPAEGENETQEEIKVLLMTQNGILGQLAEAVENIPTGTTEVTQIIELLQNYLPEAAAKEHGLDSEMNQWTRD